MALNSLAVSHKWLREHADVDVPAGRWGETADLVGTCLYLASAASNHMTGACISVNGGYVAVDGLERG